MKTNQTLSWAIFSERIRMSAHPLLTLIADDSEDDRFLFGRAVGSLPGFDLVGEMVNGVEALMYLRGFGAYGNREKYPFPDLLLLDYEMPGYNGMEVLAEVRNAPRRPTIILWSSVIEQIDRRRALELGAAMICAKPALTLEIHKLLKAAQALHLVPAGTSPWIAGPGRIGIESINKLEACPLSP